MEGLKDNGFLFPYIRFFNASMHGGKMDFYIGNTMVAASIGFGQYTGYMKCKTGPQSYKVTREGKKDDVIEKIIIEQNVGEVTTLCMTGKADNPQIFVINEPTDKNNITYGHLRICNLCPEKISFDVYVNNKKILGDIGYREISKYMEMHGAEYDFTVFDNEKKVLSCGMHNVKQGKFNTLYIIGLTNENPPLSDVFTIDAASYSGFYL